MKTNILLARRLLQVRYQIPHEILDGVFIPAEEKHANRP